MTLTALQPPLDHPVRLVDANIVTDAIWTRAEPDDRLEHVYSRPGDGRLDIVLYILAPTAADAIVAAERIVRVLLADTPMLAGWHPRTTPRVTRFLPDPHADPHPHPQGTG